MPNTVLYPVRSFNEVITIGGKSTVRTVHTLPRFTIPDDKILVVELVEKTVAVTKISVSKVWIL